MTYFLDCEYFISVLFFQAKNNDSTPNYLIPLDNNKL